MDRESRRSYYNNKIPAGSVCALCGAPAENVDHIVARGIARLLEKQEYDKASRPANLQFVCVPCHKEKTREDFRAMAFLRELESRKGRGEYTCPHCQREFAVAIYLYECPCTTEMKECAETGVLSQYVLPQGLLRELQESGRLWELPRRSWGIADYYGETRRRYLPLTIGLTMFQSTQWLDGVIRKTFEDEEWVERLHRIAQCSREQREGKELQQRLRKIRQQVLEGTAHATKHGTCTAWKINRIPQPEVVFCHRKAKVYVHDDRKMCQTHARREEKTEAQLQMSSMFERMREEEELWTKFLAAREARLAAKTAS